MPDSVFNLLSAGLQLPPGWAMPNPGPAPTAPSQLRALMNWAADEDGQAQLVRYYHGMICANPWALLELGGLTPRYSRSAVFKPALESPTLALHRSRVTGSMTLGWRPSPATGVLTAHLVFDSATELVLGEKRYAVQLQEQDDYWELVTDPELDIRASVELPDTPSTHVLYLRPTDFDMRERLAFIGQNMTSELAQAQLLGAYLNAPLISDKIALAWVAISRIEAANQ